MRAFVLLPLSARNPDLKVPNIPKTITMLVSGGFVIIASVSGNYIGNQSQE
jgi:hypothetical protein